MPLPLLLAWSAVAGMAIPVMAAMTGTLGRSLGSPVHGAAVTVAGAFATVLVTLLALRPPMPAGPLFAAAPAWAFFGGLGMALYGLSAAFITPKFGVGNFVITVVCAQLVMSAMIDQFGLFGAPVNPIDLKRLAGLGLLAIGAMLVALK
jgi:transporter family-2 protein